MSKEQNKYQEEIGLSTLQRYTGSNVGDFKEYILLVNFPSYLENFSKLYQSSQTQGTVMKTVHSEKLNISVINYGVGSPVAALVIDLLSFIKPKAVLMIGMCGGLRQDYQVGDFFNPVAAVRGEGTSDAYMPPQIPSLSSFTLQRTVVETLEKQHLPYHTGVIHTTNIRFWEFDKNFINTLKEERVQAIDMECATLFTAGYAKEVPIGALMLISDLPLKQKGIKTDESAKEIFRKHSQKHLKVGIDILQNIQVNVQGNPNQEYSYF
jgi:AMP nucleosidase